jgi:hypothetical protein
MVPVYGVAFGIAVGKFYRYVVDWVDEELDLSKKIGTVVIAGLLMLLLITPIKSADATGLREVPSMNDGWFNTLDKINPGILCHIWILLAKQHHVRVVNVFFKLICYFAIYLNASIAFARLPLLVPLSRNIQLSFTHPNHLLPFSYVPLALQLPLRLPLK